MRHDDDGEALGTQAQDEVEDVPRLPDAERRRGLVLSRSLRVAREMFAGGERDAVKIRDAVRRTIASEAGVQLDYATVVDGETLEELTRIDSTAVVLIAARVGTTRLIDNEILSPNSIDS